LGDFGFVLCKLGPNKPGVGYGVKRESKQKEKKRKERVSPEKKYRSPETGGEKNKGSWW